MDNDNYEMPYEYDNDNDTAITEVKNDRNMTNDELKDVALQKKAKKFKWREEAVKAFNEIKKLLINPPSF